MQQPGLHSGIPRQGVSSQQRHVLRPDNQFIHTYTLKTVKSHFHTFLPWAIAWERLFQACFLSSVNLMEAHRAPKRYSGLGFHGSRPRNICCKRSYTKSAVCWYPTKTNQEVILSGSCWNVLGGFGILSVAFGKCDKQENITKLMKMRKSSTCVIPKAAKPVHRTQNRCVVTVIFSLWWIEIPE